MEKKVAVVSGASYGIGEKGHYILFISIVYK